MNQVQVPETSSPATVPQQAMQTLTPQEIAAVAGGPEATVGSGINPP